MNESDSEMVAGWYEQKNWQKTENIGQADEIVINTCSVRESAENRVFGLVHNLAKDLTKGKHPKIILTGCMLRYSLRWLRENLPEVDEFKKINEFSGGLKRKIRESKTLAYIPIMEGCNNFCSYCVVPYARGREVSRPLEEIICETKELVDRGYTQVMLLGQNVNSYGKDFSKKGARKTNNFANLLCQIHKLAKIKKISFLTSNPWDLDEEIIEAMSLPKIDRYLHLPVQSGSDIILKKMNRRYSAKEYLDLIKKIREKITDIQIGTDIIVGFPGETNKEFKETLALCKKVNFIKAYVAMYSPRMQTAAYKMKNDVSPTEKRKRWKILDNLINKKQRR